MPESAASSASTSSGASGRANRSPGPKRRRAAVRAPARAAQSRPEWPRRLRRPARRVNPPHQQETTQWIPTYRYPRTHQNVQRRERVQGSESQGPQEFDLRFLGPNGAGKSTTIKLLLGLTRPTAGTASVFDQDVTQHSVAIRQRIGYLAQD